MAVKNTNSYFARFLKKIPLVGSAVDSAQNYYFNKGLKGGKEDIIIKAQKKIESIKPRPIDFSPIVNKIQSPIVRTPVSFFTTALSEMANVPTRFTHYGYRLGEADKPQELIGATAGVAGAIADFPMAGAAFSLGKKAFKDVGKQSISSLLRQGAKQGIKSGASLGALYGLEEGIDAPDLKTQMLSGIKGGVAGGVLGGATGAGLVGAGLGYQALKKADFGSQAGFVKPSEIKISNLLTKKKAVKQDFGSIKNELLNEFKRAKNFNKTRAKEALDYVGKRLGNEKLAEIKYKTTTGSGFQFDEFWRMAKAELKKKAPRALREAEWDSRLKYVDELINKKPAKPLITEVIDIKSVDKANKSFTSIDDLIRRTSDPIIQLKGAIKKKVNTKADISKVFSDVESKLINIGRNLQESAAKKGITNNELYDLYTSGNHKRIKGEAKLLKEVHETLRSILPEGSKLNNIENYMHRFFKGEGLELTEVFPSVYFDEVDMAGGFKKHRTGKMEVYEKDIPTVLKQIGREILYEKNKDFVEAEATGQTVAKVKAKRSFVKKVIKDIKENKPLIGVSEEAKKVVRADYKSRGVKPPRTKIVKGEVDLWSFLLDTQTENLRKGGIYEVYRPLRQAWLTTHNIFSKNTVNGLDLKSVVNAFSEAGRKDASKLADTAFKKFANDPKGLESFVKLQIYRNVKSEALDQVIEFLGTHRFQNNNLQKVAEWTLLREMAVDILPQDIVHKALGVLRQTYYRGAIGFNIRSALNNVLEVKRAIAVGNIKDIPDAFRLAFDKKAREEILSKYANGLSDVYEMLDKRGEVKRVKGLFAKIDPVMFKMFQDTENLKDAVLLEMLVRDGQRKGLSGTALDNFVIDSFDKFAHKYSTWGTVGLFRSDLARTGLQFMQYPLKEAGLLYKQSKKGLSGIEHLLKGEKITAKEAEGLRYMTKLATMNIALTTILGSLYNASAEEIWGAFPFNISREGNIQPQMSPAISLLNNTVYAAQDYLEGVKEGRDELLSGKVKKDLTRSLALLVPGGNQALLKTGRTIGDLLRGYNKTASGNLHFLAPEGVGQTATALIMGPYSTQNASSYFKNEERALGENQTQDFKTLWDLGDKQGARAYYEQIMANRDKERAEKQMVQAIEKGTYTGNPSDYDVSVDRKQSIFDLIAGGFRKNKDIKDALNENETLSAPYTTAEVDEAIKEADEITINDLLQEKAQKDAKNALIKRVFGNKTFATLTEEQKLRYLEAKGITEDDLYSWQMSQLAKIDPKEKARYIIANKITDFTTLYKEGAIQLDDLKELQRQGYIDSATDLWDKLKMTDVYYREEALRKLKIKYGKKLIQNKYDTMIKVQKQYFKNIEDLLNAVPSYKPVGLPSSSTTNYAAKLRSRL